MKFEENDREPIKGLTYTSFLKKFLKSLFSQAPNRAKMEENEKKKEESRNRVVPALKTGLLTTVSTRKYIFYLIKVFEQALKIRLGPDKNKPDMLPHQIRYSELNESSDFQKKIVMEEIHSWTSLRPKTQLLVSQIST